MIFEEPLWRFSCSGTLLAIYGVVEWRLRRAGHESDRPGVKPPAFLKIGIFLALSAFYLLIGPTGRAIAGGWGNIAGILLALGAVFLRFAVRNGVPGLRHPVIAARLVFYTALPLAVGVPWGWVVFSLPAWILWAACTWREDAILAERLGQPYRDLMARTDRLIPRIW